MVHSIFKPELYLKRINYPEKIETIKVSFQSLKALHYAQISSIPFENFDICLNQNIELDAQSIFNKLVLAQRGGYCFENNGLLMMALKYFGFSVRPLLGRVHLSGSPSGRVHQVSLVSLNNEQWIVDAGFGGDCPQEPLPLILNTEFVTRLHVMRFINNDLFGTMLQVKKEGLWSDLYSFDLSYVCEADIKCGNHYTSTHPDSIFVNNRVASLTLDDGFVTLLNYTLKITKVGKTAIKVLPPGQGYIDALNENFGITLANAYEDLKCVS